MEKCHQHHLSIMHAHTLMYSQRVPGYLIQSNIHPLNHIHKLVMIFMHLCDIWQIIMSACLSCAVVI